MASLTPWHTKGLGAIMSTRGPHDNPDPGGMGAHPGSDQQTPLLGSWLCFGDLLWSMTLFAPAQ